MHHRFAAVPIAVLLAASAAGCSAKSSTVNTAPAAPAASSPGGAAAATTPAATKAVATVGQAISLAGAKSGDSLSITLVKVVDPASGSDQFTQPDPGKVFVGVQFKIDNTGSGAYSDDPDTDAVLIDSQGQQYQPDFSTISEGPNLNSSLDLAPGATTLGFEVFQVPKGTTLAQVQYQLSGGLSTTAAQWNISS